MRRRRDAIREILRQHQLERAAWAAERERLLDRIMLLADKPMFYDTPASETPDLVDDDFADQDAVYFALTGETVSTVAG